MAFGFLVQFPFQVRHEDCPQPSIYRAPAADRRKFFYYAPLRHLAIINEGQRVNSSAFDASCAGSSRISFSSVILGANLSVISTVTSRAAE